MSKFITKLFSKEADDYISAFFGKNEILIKTFKALCNHMYELNDKVMLRGSAHAIGVCEKHERYRFYVNKRDRYSIKYKIWGKPKEFISQSIEEYFSCNIECNKFFVDHPENCTLRKSITIDDSYILEGEVAENRKKATEINRKKLWQVVNEKAKRAALLSALSKKVADGEFIVVDELKVSAPKTKEMAAFQKALGLTKAIVVMDNDDVNVIRAAANLPTLATLPLAQLSTYEVVANKFVVMTKAAVEKFQEVNA